MIELNIAVETCSLKTIDFNLLNDCVPQIHSIFIWKDSS